MSMTPRVYCAVLFALSLCVFYVFFPVNCNAELTCGDVVWEQDFTQPDGVQIVSYNATIFDHNLLIESIRFNVSDPTLKITSMSHYYDGSYQGKDASHTGDVIALESDFPWTQGNGVLTYFRYTLLSGVGTGSGSGNLTLYQQDLDVVCVVDVSFDCTNSSVLDMGAAAKKKANNNKHSREIGGCD